MVANMEYNHRPPHDGKYKVQMNLQSSTNHATMTSMLDSNCTNHSNHNVHPTESNQLYALMGLTNTNTPIGSTNTLNHNHIWKYSNYSIIEPL